LTPWAQPEAEPTVAACRRIGVRFMGAAFDAAAATRAERDAQARSSPAVAARLIEQQHTQVCTLVPLLQSRA